MVKSDPSDPLSPRDVFICHAEKDFDRAKPVIDALERAGYSTWYYERDAVAVARHLDQSRKAIDQAQLVLVFVSTSAVDSPWVEPEVTHAAQAKRVVVPVLVDLPEAEVRERKPDWRYLFGTRGAADLGQGAQAAAAAICWGLRFEGILPRPATPPAPPSKYLASVLPGQSGRGKQRPDAEVPPLTQADQGFAHGAPCGAGVRPAAEVYDRETMAAKPDPPSPSGPPDVFVAGVRPAAEVYDRETMAAKPDPPSPSGPPDVFVCHASQDFARAKPVIEELERAGYTTWYYERDVKPGDDHPVESRLGIESAKAVLAFFSTSARTSLWFDRELRHSVKKKKIVLPVLVDVSRERFPSTMPDWDYLLSTTAMVELGEDPEKAGHDICDGLRKKGVVTSGAIPAPAVSRASVRRAVLASIVALAFVSAALIIIFLVTAGHGRPALPATQADALSRNDHWKKPSDASRGDNECGNLYSAEQKHVGSAWASETKAAQCCERCRTNSSAHSARGILVCYSACLREGHAKPCHEDFAPRLPQFIQQAAQSWLLDGSGYDDETPQQRSPDDLCLDRFEAPTKVFGGPGGMPNASLRGADLFCATFDHMNLDGARFDHVDEPNPDRPLWLGADLRFAIFRAGSVRSANFEKAILVGTTFGDGVDLSGANMDGALLAGADLAQANWDEPPTLTGAILCEDRAADSLRDFKCASRAADFGENFAAKEQRPSCPGLFALGVGSHRVRLRESQQDSLMDSISDPSTRCDILACTESVPDSDLARNTHVSHVPPRRPVE